MKFKATPGLYVKISNKYLQRATGMKGFYFDDKGEYETDNEVFIKALGQNFEVVEAVAEKTKDKPIRSCKKCGFTCVSQGEMFKHYKQEHPKEGSQ